MSAEVVGSFLAGLVTAVCSDTYTHSYFGHSSVLSIIMVRGFACPNAIILPPCEV